MNTPQQHFRTCHLCEAMCGVVIEHQDGEILSIKGDKADVLSKGHICPKAVALKDLQEDPDRIRRPMKRIGSEWVEISWNDAFDMVEKNIKRIQAEHGHDAVGVYIGNPTAHHPGALLMLGPLLAAVKTGSRFSASSVDQLAVMFATHEMLGSPALMTIPDLDRSDFLLMIGANPAASNGSLMSAGDPMGKIQAISTRGGRVVVVDPRKTESAVKADQHLFIRPGTDVFLLAAMLQVLFVEDRINLGNLAAFTDGLELLRNAVSDVTPESVAEITGITADEIRTLARDFSSAKRAVCYGRIGSNVQEFGGLTAWLIYALNIVTGNLDREGGAMFTQPAIDIIGLSGATDLAGGLNTERTRVRGLPIFAGEKPVAVMAEEMLTKGAGQIRALITHAGNPVLSTPNGRQLDEALEGLEFMVCIDIYLNETTRHANLILPPTGALERGHFDLLLNAWAVRNIVKYSPPLLPAPVDSRHDWQIMLELIVRLNSKNAFDRTLWRGLQRGLEALKMEGMLDLMLRVGPYGYRPKSLSKLDELFSDFFFSSKPYKLSKKSLSTWLGSSQFKPLADATSIFSNRTRRLNLKMIEAEPHGIDLGPLQSVLPRRLFTADRRIKLAPEIYLNDMARARTRLQGQTKKTDRTDMLLIGRRHVRSNNSWMHNSHRLVKGKNRCTAMLHPEDAARLQIENGSLVRISSRVGSIDLPAEITSEIMLGVVSVPHGFGHDRDGIKLGIASQHAGVSLNDITDEQYFDALTGVAALNGLPVQIESVMSK